MAKKKYTVLSLFSGGMGLDLGVESSGRFNLLACIEKDPVCCETIRLNIGNRHLKKNVKVYEGDISDIQPEALMDELGLNPGEIDLIIGGPPCQAFSTAGKRASVQDPRGTLLWQFLKFVEVFQPKFFLMENVRGLVSAALKHRPISERPDKGGPPLEPEEEPGSVVRKFAEDLQSGEVQYHLDAFEVNSVNYGAPQIRERVIFIGNRFSEILDFPDPTHKNGLQISEEQQGLFDESPLKPWKTLRDAIGDLKESDPEIMDFSPRKKGYLKKVPEGSNWRSLPEEDQKESMGKAWYAKGGRSGWWRRLTFDLPSPTLITMPNHASTSLCHPIETRALTVREYSRIQEFPDDWSFSGKPSDKYRQIGNAVPVRLGKVAAEVISEKLDQISSPKYEPPTVKPDSYRIVYIQSHVRTRSWFKNGKTVVWNDKNPSDSYYGAAKTTRKIKAI